MKYSNLLNLGEILKDAPTYVIMRRSPDFPNYYRGQDVDILVANMDDMIKHLYSHSVLAQCGISKTHIQMDYYQDGFDIKFDLYSHHISSRLTSEILASRFPLRIPSGYTFYTFSVPQPIMDNILKCYEWMHHKKAKYKDFAKYHHQLKEYEI